jgi:hypothetical protein
MPPVAQPVGRQGVTEISITNSNKNDSKMGKNDAPTKRPATKRSSDERSGDESSGDERSGILNVRQWKVRPQNIRQGYFGTKRPLISLLYCLARPGACGPSDGVQDCLEAHAQDKRLQDNQDDISSFLTYY